MDIYLLRHGTAAPLGRDNSFRDERRELTAEGIQKTQQAARGLLRLGISFDLIVSSPLVRAQQTAGIVAEEVKFAEPIAEWDELSPEGSVEPVMKRLAACRDRNSVLLVGHQPSMGSLAAYLISGNTRVSLPFKKGAVLSVRVTEIPPQLFGEILWMLPSRMLRRIAEY